MTRKEIEAARKSLPRILDIPRRNWTDKQRKTDDELDCREMINSCLCYGGIEGFWQKFDSFPEGWHSYADRYIAKLGEKRVREIVAEQERDFAKATVSYDVYTDCEGCTYNSIRWVDE